MENEKSINTKLIGFTTVAAILGMGFAAAMSASADSGLGYGSERGQCDAEQHEAVEEALEDGDYDAWIELMDGRGRITSVVTEDNFDTFVDMHEAMENGYTEVAQELREDLGLGMRAQDGSGYRNGDGEGKGEGRGMRDGNMHRGQGSGDGINNRWTN